MSGFFENRRKKKVDKMTFACLVQAMAADGDIDESELDMLADMARGLEISRSEATGILKGKGGSFQKVKMTREEVIRIIVLVANMIAADGKITPEEELLCKKMSAALGLKPNALLDIAKEIVDKKVAEQQVGQEIGKMLDAFQ